MKKPILKLLITITLAVALIFTITACGGKKPKPTNNPTKKPTNSPSITPTNSPSVNPTNKPTQTPSSSPTQTPSSSPTTSPTTTPTTTPTTSPTTTPAPTQAPEFDYEYWYNEYLKNQQKAQEIEKLLTTGGNVVISDNITLSSISTLIENQTNITLNGTLSTDRANMSGAETFSTLTVKANTEISGKGTIKNNGGYAITLKGDDATLTIKGGIYMGKTTAINVVKGDLIINDGFFFVEDESYSSKYTVNCIDQNFKDGTCSVLIKGGTFVNFNPMQSQSENPTANFLAEGYSVVSNQKQNGDIWYTVIKTEQ